MPKILIRVVLDMVLLIFTAISGAFIWKHSSDIFNAGGNYWSTFVSELGQYASAYIVILIFLIIIFLLLLLRHTRTWPFSEE